MNEITRLLQLMLYKEAGGTGYDPAIAKLAAANPDFYDKTQQEIAGIKSI
jgi:hypothetical protein